MEIAYNITGDRRKELVAALVDITGEPKKYEGVGTKAFVVGDYRIDKDGTLTGKRNHFLTGILAEYGFVGTEVAA